MLLARSVFTGLALMMTGYGVSSTLVGIQATVEGFPTQVIGLLSAAYYVGLAPGTLVTSRMVGRVGHVRAFAALASVAAIVPLGHALVVDPASWISFKFVTGFCLAGMTVVAESWLNSISTNATRGRLLAIYLVVGNVGFGGGQAILTIEDRPQQGFIVAAALFSLAVVPLTLSVAPAPADTYSRGALPFRRLIQDVPLAVVAIIVAGAATGSVLGLGAVYGTLAGMRVPEVAALMGAAMVGGFVLQLPLGTLSDRFPRRRVILTTTIVAGILALGGAVVEQGSTGTIVAMGAFTAVSFPMYSMAVSHMNDQIEHALLLPAAAAMLLFYGLGSILGPLVASTIIESVGPVGFWWTLATAHLSLAPYVLYRLAIRTGLPLPQRPSISYPTYATPFLSGGNGLEESTSERDAS